MSDSRYDIICIGDFRFPGGTSSAIAEELRAQAKAGFRTGLLQIKGPILKYPHPFNPQIRACIDEGLVELLDPDQRVSAGLAVIHHPNLFANRPSRHLMVEADQRVLVVHHPPYDGLGVPSFNLHECATNTAEALEGEVTWAPIGPVVRNQLETFEDHPPLLDEDWYNILHTEQWHHPRPGFCDEQHPVIGRHSRPDYLKWPDDPETILKVYPDRPDVLVRILGGGPYLQELVGTYPKNWQVWSFNEIDPQRFLGLIDFFVYFHHSHWIEAFGRTILEAMASGCVLVLPERMKALFGEGALYTDTDGAVDLVRDLHADREACLRQRTRSLELVKERFGQQVHVQRLEKLIGKPGTSTAVTAFKPPSSAETPPAPPSPPVHTNKRRRALFMTSNGIGMGHLTRMLAVARRCSDRVEPIFLTMSQAISVVRKQGYHAEFLPFHAYLGVNHTDWNKHLREEINTFLAFHEPSVVVFDGNVPYSGLIGAIRDNPEPLYVWCRRGMWRPGSGDDIIKREKHFDGVIEPGELAHVYDQGATVQHQGRTVQVPPIRFLDDQDMLTRDAALAELGLKADRPKALILLGSGNNFDFSHLRRIAIEHLAEKHEAQIVIGEWVIAQQEREPGDTYQRLQSFPFSRYFKGFDLIISAAGYNSFHELMFSGVPTIFVPNESPEMDEQLLRGQFAERRGVGMVVRTHELFRISKTIDDLLDQERRSEIAKRALMLERDNGAEPAARLIEEMAFSRRTDRHLVV